MVKNLIQSTQETEHIKSRYTEVNLDNVLSFLYQDIYHYSDIAISTIAI